MRSYTSSTSMGSTSRPVSSLASRTTPVRSVSPSSSTPPGMDHSPFSGSVARRTMSARPRSMMTAPTPISGRSGYSRFMMDGLRKQIPGREVHDLPALRAALAGKTYLLVATHRRGAFHRWRGLVFEIHQRDAPSLFRHRLLHFVIDAKAAVVAEPGVHLVGEPLVLREFRGVESRERLARVPALHAAGELEHQVIRHVGAKRFGGRRRILARRSWARQHSRRLLLRARC